MHAGVVILIKNWKLIETISAGAVANKVVGEGEVLEDNDRGSRARWSGFCVYG